MGRGQTTSAKLSSQDVAIAIDVCDASSMKIHGQRWRYQLANTEVFVDNAFSWFGWAQERMLINGEVSQSVGSWFSFKRNFNEPWLTLSGDGEIEILMRSTLTGVDVELRLDGEVVEHEELFETAWHGRGAWPDEGLWIKTEQFSIFKQLSPH